MKIIVLKLPREYMSVAKPMLLVCVCYYGYEGVICAGVLLLATPKLSGHGIFISYPRDRADFFK